LGGSVRTENMIDTGTALVMKYEKHALFRYCQACPKRQVICSRQQQDGSLEYVGYTDAYGIQVKKFEEALKERGDKLEEETI